MCRCTVMNAHRRLTRKRRNCWIKPLFLFSLGTKKYFRRFIKLRFNHWCHMDYFNNVLTNFLGLECGSCVAVYGGSESSQISSKYLNLCSADERRSYGFGTTWGWVIKLYSDSIILWPWILVKMQFGCLCISNYYYYDILLFCFTLYFIFHSFIRNLCFSESHTLALYVELTASNSLVCSSSRGYD